MSIWMMMFILSDCSNSDTCSNASSPEISNSPAFRWQVNKSNELIPATNITSDPWYHIEQPDPINNESALWYHSQQLSNTIDTFDDSQSHIEQTNFKTEDAEQSEGLEGKVPIKQHTYYIILMDSGNVLSIH